MMLVLGLGVPTLAGAAPGGLIRIGGATEGVPPDIAGICWCTTRIGIGLAITVTAGTNLIRIRRRMTGVLVIEGHRGFEAGTGPNGSTGRQLQGCLEPRRRAVAGLVEEWTTQQQLAKPKG